jgi:prepilin-type N-terminal cleavage/methylation domain-containing protein
MRLRREEGFGLLELLVAIVILSIGIMALMGVFAAGTLSLRRSASTSTGTAVADKVMEVYRGLKNCGIYLSSSTIPTSGQYSAQYYADTSAYANVGTYSGSNHLWVTEATTSGSYTPIPSSSAGCLPSPTPSPDPTQAVQQVTGPDGLSYLTFSYVVLVQLRGPAGTYSTAYVKQVTVEVFNPKNTSQLLAKETSVFDPNASG